MSVQNHTWKKLKMETRKIEQQGLLEANMFIHLLFKIYLNLPTNWFLIFGHFEMTAQWDEMVAGGKSPSKGKSPYCWESGPRPGDARFQNFLLYELAIWMEEWENLKKLLSIIPVKMRKQTSLSIKHRICFRCFLLQIMDMVVRGRIVRVKKTWEEKLFARMMETQWNHRNQTHANK